MFSEEYLWSSCCLCHLVSLLVRCRRSSHMVWTQYIKGIRIWCWNPTDQSNASRYEINIPACILLASMQIRRLEECKCDICLPRCANLLGWIPKIYWDQNKRKNAKIQHEGHRFTCVNLILKCLNKPLIFFFQPNKLNKLNVLLPDVGGR